VAQVVVAEAVVEEEVVEEAAVDLVDVAVVLVDVAVGLVGVEAALEGEEEVSVDVEVEEGEEEDFAVAEGIESLPSSTHCWFGYNFLRRYVQLGRCASFLWKSSCLMTMLHLGQIVNQVNGSSFLQL
jgi:hypothetical protein